MLEGQRDWDTARTEARSLGAGFFLSHLLTSGAGSWTIVAVLLGLHIPSLLHRRKEDYSQHSIAPAASLSVCDVGHSPILLCQECVRVLRGACA